MVWWAGAQATSGHLPCVLGKSLFFEVPPCFLVRGIDDLTPPRTPGKRGLQAPRRLPILQDVTPTPRVSLLLDTWTVVFLKKCL